MTERRGRSAETARKGIAKARKTASGVIAATVEKGEAIIDDTREKSFRAAAETNRLFQEHPVAAVAAAAAVGAVLGIFLPRLTLAGKAGRLAGRAVNAAATSEVAKIALKTLGEAQKVGLRDTTGKAATAMSSRLVLRQAKRPKLANGPVEAATAEPVLEVSQDAPDDRDTPGLAQLGYSRRLGTGR